MVGALNIEYCRLQNVVRRREGLLFFLTRSGLCEREKLTSHRGRTSTNKDGVFLSSTGNGLIARIPLIKQTTHTSTTVLRLPVLRIPAPPSPLRMIAARCPFAPSDASTGGWPLYFLHCLILANIGAFRSMLGTMQNTIWFPRIYSCCKVAVLPRISVLTQSCCRARTAAAVAYDGRRRRGGGDHDQ